MNNLEIKCTVCNKKPDEIEEYKEMVVNGDYKNANDAVRNEEGTYNPWNGHFYCTDCYIKIGMPNGIAI